MASRRVNPIERHLATAKVAAAALLAAALFTAAWAQEQAPSRAASAPATAASREDAIGNPFLGGVPDGAPTAETLSLTLADAVSRGLERNLGAILSSQSVQSAGANQKLARSGLLPTVNASASGVRQEINFEAFGIPLQPGQDPVTPPFNVLDGRVYATMPLLDLAALERSRAGGQGLEVARLGYRDARELVVLTCASLYLQAALGASRIEAARAQEAVSVALLERARRLKESGVVPGIEVLRAQVQREAQRQRLIYYENEFAKQKLALARAIGVPLGQKFELAEKLSHREAAPPTAESAIAEALASRADLLQAEAALASAEATRKADRYDAYPTILFKGDYGWIGLSNPSLERTFSLGVGARIPIFEGGRIRARVRQDDAALAQLRARRDDLGTRVEYEVRAALLDLDAAGERVTVARGALELAEEQLRQSQDRFAAGVAGNLEVVQAQDAEAAASDNYLSALYAHNIAKVALARATGSAERTLPALLGGDGGTTR